MLTRCVGNFYSVASGDVLTILLPTNLAVMEIQVFAVDGEIIHVGLSENDAIDGAIVVYPGQNTQIAASSVNTVFKLRAAHPEAPIVTPLYISCQRAINRLNNVYVVFTGLEK